MRRKGTNLRKCMGAVVTYSAIFFFLLLYLSHSNMQYVKRQVILWSTTLVYHSHIEKCGLGVEKLEKMNPWRPFFKMAAKAVKTQNSAWKTKYSCSATRNHYEKSVCQLFLKNALKP